MYQKFHKQIECSDYSLNEAILGVAQAPKVQIDNTNSSGQADLVPVQSSNQLPYTFMDEVIEKPEICSTVAPQYKNIVVRTLADIMFSGAESINQEIKLPASLANK